MMMWSNLNVIHVLQNYCFLYNNNNNNRGYYSIIWQPIQSINWEIIHTHAPVYPSLFFCRIIMSQASTPTEGNGEYFSVKGSLLFLFDFVFIFPLMYILFGAFNYIFYDFFVGRIFFAALLFNSCIHSDVNFFPGLFVKSVIKIFCLHILVYVTYKHLKILSMFAWKISVQIFLMTSLGSAFSLLLLKNLSLAGGFPIEKHFSIEYSQHISNWYCF